MGIPPVSSRVGTYKSNSFSFSAVAWPGAALIEMSDLYLKRTLSTLTPWRNRSHKCQEDQTKRMGRKRCGFV